jgi:pimeloyl-ACP methyl ester carboxylesterase
MKLNFKFYPKDNSSTNKSSNHNLIVLHGLFGSSKNWVSISKQLASRLNVYSLDLRNHGDSPHSEEHTIQCMAEDLAHFIEEHQLKNVSLLGHSMGGLVSMYFDLTHPNLLDFLIIQDIAPRNYPFAYENEIASMLLDISSAKSRSDVDAKMIKYVPDAFIRQFLQMNLERNSGGEYYWKLNVKGIGESRRLFTDIFNDLSASQTPSLFVLGGNSEYIQEDDRRKIHELFKNANIQSILGGGHYIHFTHANEFLKIVSDFLDARIV